ncbi:MAG: NAD(P)/FAD-dependent oxidoreductase [Gemmatimonadales bacterium]
MAWAAEVGIVGAGPAGAWLAARLAERGVEVLVWDPRSPWEKPCGGGLSAAALRLVPELAGVVSRARPITRVEFVSDRGLGLGVPLSGPIHVVSRAGLARWHLARAESAGARVVGEAVTRMAPASGGWLVTLRSGRVQQVRCLVGADGAASAVRAVVAPSVAVALEPTRVAYPGGAGPTPDTIRIRFPRTLAGYAWDFPRPDHRSVGAVAEPHSATRNRLEREVVRLLPDPADAGERVGAVIGSAALPVRFDRLGGSDFALLGDAAGLADPATGEGIPNALRSAELAAEAFLRQRSFAGYARLAAACFAAEFRKARLLRWLLYHRRAGNRLVEAAIEGPGAPAARRLLEAFINGANEHDSGLVRLLRRAANPSS